MHPAGVTRVSRYRGNSQRREEYRLILSDLRIPIQMQRWYRNAPEQLHLDLPDKRFEASLAAQTTHLMMSLIGRETRPGDPIFFYRASATTGGLYRDRPRARG